VPFYLPDGMHCGIRQVTDQMSAGDVALPHGLAGQEGTWRRAVADGGGRYNE